MSTKYKVSMSNPVARGSVYTDDANTNDDNGQSMIVSTSLVDKPNEPKNYSIVSQSIYISFPGR